MKTPIDHIQHTAHVVQVAGLVSGGERPSALHKLTREAKCREGTARAML